LLTSPLVHNTLRRDPLQHRHTPLRCAHVSPPLLRAVQACWDCRNKELGAFLHSPLIDELRALERLSDAHHSSQGTLERVTPPHTSRLALLSRRSKAQAACAEHSASGRAASPLASVQALNPAAAARTMASSEGTSCSTAGCASHNCSIIASLERQVRQCVFLLVEARTAVDSWLRLSTGDAMHVDIAVPQACEGAVAAAGLTADTSPADTPRSSGSDDSAESTSFRCAICLVR
jgi:hypothetical protein